MPSDCKRDCYGPGPLCHVQRGPGPISIVPALYRNDIHLPFKFRFAAGFINRTSGKVPGAGADRDPGPFRQSAVHWQISKILHDMLDHASDVLPCHRVFIAPHDAHRNLGCVIKALLRVPSQFSAVRHKKTSRRPQMQSPGDLFKLFFLVSMNSVCTLHRGAAIDLFRTSAAGRPVHVHHLQNPGLGHGLEKIVGTAPGNCQPLRQLLGGQASVRHGPQHFQHPVDGGL